MRGVTAVQTAKIANKIISTHTPHARRDASNTSVEMQLNISTHTPHARRDKIAMKIIDIISISTHTPHARRDAMISALGGDQENFNSHASCEA